jgi:hypothetical protein
MSVVKGGGPGAVPFGIVGTSPAIVEVVHFIQKFGPTAHTVLITGETGTGKELVATAFHAASGRGPLMSVNCSAISPELAESELFGHVKGAFTGADRGRKGHFAAAAGGTIFLDEIGDLPHPLQSKLLRVLENGEILPLGTSQPGARRGRWKCCFDMSLTRRAPDHKATTLPDWLPGRCRFYYVDQKGCALARLGGGFGLQVVLSLDPFARTVRNAS